MTAKQLAAAAGYRHSVTIYQIESGVKNPSGPARKAIAQALRAKESELFPEEGDAA